MMIPVFRNCLFLAILLTNFTNLLRAQEKVVLNDSIAHQLADEFFLFTPIYENHLQLEGVKAISYTVAKIKRDDFLKNLSLGTYLVCFEPVMLDTITSTCLYREVPITQLISKKSSGYVGYLEELVNVPFILPPRNIKEGHQTDLRLGVDCAALAIYGRRKMGHPIPYIGPRGIGKYLEKTDYVEQGSVIVFGNSYHVAVVYEDRGTIGVLDDEDLIVHAYKDKAEVVRLKDAGLSKYHHAAYRWKE